MEKMSDYGDKKTACENAVFLSGGKKCAPEILPFSGVSFGDGAAIAEKFILDRCGVNEEKRVAAAVCRDSGYFSIGKRIALPRETVSFFSFDDGRLDEKIAEKLLASVSNLSAIVIIGDGEIVSLTVGLAKKLFPLADLLVVPTDYSFCRFLSENARLVKDGLYFAFDDEVFSKLKKNKVADALRSVFSKRLLFVEMRVNELIGGVFDKKTAVNHLNESIRLSGEYFLEYDYRKLVCATVVSALACEALPFDNPADRLADVLSTYDLETEPGERSYLAYKILLKLYGIFLCSEEKMLKVPSYVFAVRELTALSEAGTQLFEIQTPPAYLADDVLLSDVYEKVRGDEIIRATVEELTRRIPFGERMIYSLYGGRKHSVESYSSEAKANALKLAPAITRGDNLLKIVWASGFTEWL